jgi:hypothetical protein
MAFFGMSFERSNKMIIFINMQYTMKAHTITRYLALFFLLIGLNAQAQSNSSKAEFKFDTESHDFGKIPQGKPVSYEFSFTNVGSEPIIISAINSSCGCSVAEFSKTPVAPGEKGKIKVTFDAAAKAPFTKHFTIRSNTKTPVKTLVIKGEVIS